VPLGVVGAIYESRPNVTVDVAALCLRSGNACVLERRQRGRFLQSLFGGFDSPSTCKKQDVDPNAVMLLPTDRQFVTELLTATRYVDIIIPRGSESLIQFVRKNSLIPTIETGSRRMSRLHVQTTADLDQST
jgi:glutamate-5-semialdehyde dehydrogenase